MMMYAPMIQVSHNAGEYADSENFPRLVRLLARFPRSRRIALMRDQQYFCVRRFAKPNKQSNYADFSADPS
jgi:hypothetical protein